MYSLAAVIGKVAGHELLVEHGLSGEVGGGVADEGDTSLRFRTQERRKTKRTVPTVRRLCSPAGKTRAGYRCIKGAVPRTRKRLPHT